MSLSKDTAQIQITKRGKGWQVLHFCYMVVGEIDFLEEEKKQHSVNKSHEMPLAKEIPQPSPGEAFSNR